MFTRPKRALPLIFFVLILVVGCFRHQQPIPGSQSAKSISGKVIRIIDGDTLVVLDSQNVQHRIRLKGIDAPERRQAFYQVSRDNLANLAFQKDIRVDYEKIDRNDRPIGVVWVDGRDACLEQIKAGLAWHFKRYQNEQLPAEREQYANAEENARSRKGGLWKDEKPTPPWDLRKTRTGSIEETASEEQSQPEPQSFHHNPNNPLQSDDRKTSDARPRVDSNSPAAPDDYSHANSADGLIRGNKRSMIYHWPGCPDYDKISPHNRVPFNSEEEAKIARYRAAKNCLPDHFGNRD